MIENLRQQEQFTIWQQQFAQEHVADPGLERQLRFANFLCALSAFPTVSSRVNNQRTPEYELASEGLVNFVSEYIRQMGEEIGYEFVIHPVVNHNGVRSLVISTHSGNEADVAFLAHYDVASGYFPTTFQNSTAHGRGVADMRAAIVVGLEALRETGIRAARGEEIPHFALWLTGDEETGGEYGAKALIEEDGYRAMTVINFDGGNPGELTTRAKGIQKIRGTIFGLSAHGARPWLAINPDQILNDAFIENFATNLRRRNTPETTYSVTRHRSTESTNTSPDQVEFTLDCRFGDPDLTEEDILLDVRQRIGLQFNSIELELQQRLSELGDRDANERGDLQRMLNAIPDLRNRIQLEGFDRSEVFVIDENDSELQRWRQIMEDVMGRPVRYMTDMGGNDSEYVVDAEHQILTAVPTASDFHGENESVTLGGMLQMFAILDRFLQGVDLSS